MEKKNIIFLALGLVLALAITACDEDGDDQYYFNNNDTSNGSNNTVQPTDSSSETIDSETETEEEIITNPHACDCLRYDDPENGCHNIEGVWYYQNGNVREWHYKMVIVLEPVGNKCRITNNTLREEVGGGGENFFVKELWAEKMPIHEIEPTKTGAIWEVHLFFLPEEEPGKLFIKSRKHDVDLPEEEQKEFQTIFFSR